MEVDLRNPTEIRTLIDFTEHGQTAGCPFCKGRKIETVSVGDRIILLKGENVGRFATVTNARGWSDDEFFAHFDDDEPGADIRVHFKRDEFKYAPLEQPPHWLCQLSIDDLCAIENAALKSSLLLGEQPIPTWNAETLLPLIGTIWARRLPISGEDLLPTLEAHGASSKLRQNFAELFDLAIQTLILLQGRPPIKRKKMGAMSQGRYLTPTQEQFFGPSPRFTS